MPEGIIYITRTPQDLPNYYKVGRTTQSTTEDRTRHDATYISGGIETIKEYKVSNDTEAEVAAHRALADVRVNIPHAREIFELDIDILIGRVKLAIQPWLIGEIQNNSQNNWILDFLSLQNTRVANYHHRDLEINQRIKLLVELMMRAASRGESAAERRIEDRTYEELINDISIGNSLEATLKNIDHQALIKIDDWYKKFEVILYLSKAPLMMSVNRDGNFEGPLRKRGIENLKSGLNGFNINEVIGYWSDNYFSSNSKLIMGCYQFLDHQIAKWNSYDEEPKDIFVRGTKNSVCKNAIHYCINNPNRNSKKIANTTISAIWDGHGADWVYENIGADLSQSLQNVREDIKRDEENYHKLIWKKVDKENTLNDTLATRVIFEEISLDEALKIFKTVNETQWVKENKKGENFNMEYKVIIPLDDIYRGKLNLDEALRKNIELKKEREKKL